MYSKGSHIEKLVQLLSDSPLTIAVQEIDSPLCIKELLGTTFINNYISK